MRIHYEPCMLEIKCDNGGLTGIALDNIEVYRELLSSILNQKNHIPSDFCISDKEKDVNWDKEVSFVPNPLLLEPNEKRILNHLYSEMQEIAFTELYEAYSSINSNIVGLLDMISKKLPYPIAFSYEMDFPAVLKAYNIQFDFESTNLSDKVVEYVRLLYRICGTRVFIFDHLQDYLTDEEIDNLHHIASTEHIFVITIGGGYRKALSGAWYIIDEENCLIQL